MNFNNMIKLPVRFHGKEYYLLTPEGAKQGPIATKEQLDNYQVSYAYLYPNGHIVRFKTIIGTIDDLEFLDSDHIPEPPKTIKTEQIVRDCLGVLGFQGEEEMKEILEDLLGSLPEDAPEEAADAHAEDMKPGPQRKMKCLASLVSMSLAVMSAAAPHAPKVTLPSPYFSPGEC